MHPRIAERIVRSAALTPGETVLEIGPGRGVLTEALLKAGAHVLAVEIDATLVATLAERFAEEIGRGDLTILHKDIRDVLARPPRALRSGYAVVANIPYYLTGELIRLLLSSPHQPSSLTLLVQKEVAERIARAKKGSLLSLSVRAYGMPKYEYTVPKGAFAPAPKVDSAVLSVRDISRARLPRALERRFFGLVRAGFAHKRKLLHKNLTEAGFSGAGIPLPARAEDLSLEDWLALAQRRDA